MNRNFTGIKDVDKLIMEKLDDRSLLSTCIASEYCNKLADEAFFKRRTLQKYPSYTIYINPRNASWKDFYLNVVRILDRRNEICRKLAEYVKERNIRASIYYLDTLEPSNIYLNYFINKFSPDEYAEGIVDYFPITYKRYIKGTEYGHYFSPEKEITSEEISTIHYILREMPPRNKIIPENLARDLNKLIYLNIVPYDVKLNEFCK